MERLDYPPSLPPDYDLDIQIVDWFIPEQAQKERFINHEIQPTYDIHIYGITRDGYTIQLIVKGFQPYFYVKCPENFNKTKLNQLNENLLSGQFEYNYIKTDWNTKEKSIQKRFAIPKRLRHHFNEIKFVKKYDFWGFQDNMKTSFLKISIQSLQLMRMMKDIFSSMKGFTLYEANIDPFLRFIHSKEISPCGWISVNSDNLQSFDDGVSQYKYEIQYNDVISIQKNIIGQILVASFDIECTSSHGDFPLAKKDYKKLVQDLNKFYKPFKESCDENGYNITTYLTKFLNNAFKKNVTWGEYTINRLYPKKQPSNIDSIIPNLIYILDREDNDEALLKYLNKNLPELEGDPIIQIGTTFHLFGSDEIIYKNIITLHSCDLIDNVDVIECETEGEVLMTWKSLIKEKNPDILTGYNILGFDFKYIYERSKELQVHENFQDGLGRSNERFVPFITRTMFSSAMGEVITSYYDMEGILIIDLFTYVRRNMSFESYKLDFVAETILKENKLDLKPSEIFKRYLGDSNDRKIIAEYCIQDCILVNRLLHKMKIIENNFGMANVCFVPANYIFHRGQTIKSLSLVAYECQKRNQCIPTLNKADSDFDEKYEGAVVLEPESGIYMEDPIVVFDYSSLYPSSMIAENLSHDSCILPEDFHKFIKDDTLISDNPNLSLNIIDDGTKKCYFVKDSTKKSTIPDILQKLIKQRKSTRNKIEYKTVTLKNGSTHSGLIKNNQIISEFNNNSFNPDDVLSIEDTYNDFEKAVFDALQLAYKITANSLYGATGASVSPIYMRDIASCTTATGRNMIYLAKNFVEEKYNSKTVYGDSVMPYTPLTVKKENYIYITTFEKLEGNWIKYKEFTKENAEQLFDPGFKIWTSNGWSKVNRVIRHKTTKTIYRIVTDKGLVDVTEDHSLLDKNLNEIKPSKSYIGLELYHSKPILQNIYLNSKNENTHEYYQNLYIKSYNQINYIDGNISLLNNSSSNSNIKHIEILHQNYTGFVYDIETEEGNFHAGIGELILKNTDSIFCKFDLYDENNKRVRGKEAIPYAIKLGQKIEKHIYDEVLYKLSPQKLAYEKVLYPLILVSKKRYTGMLYEDDPNKCFQKTMGLQIKRRDSAKIVKDVYGGILDIILKQHDLKASYLFLQKWLEKLVNGNVNIDRLILSKTLRSHYKDETKIAHKVLAERIKERDPGNAPQTNDRLPYVYIKNDEAILQGERIETIDYIREKNIPIDYLHYITNQIMKPILQLYELSIETIPGYDKSDTYWRDLDIELKTSKELYQDDTKRHKRIKDLRERTVKELLFDPYIEKLGGIKKRISTISKIEADVTPIDTNLEIVELNLQITVSKAKNNTTVKCDKNTKIYEETMNKDKKDKVITSMILDIIPKYKDKYLKFKIKGHAPYIDTFRKFKVTITSNTENKEEYLKGIVSGLHLKELIPYISKISVIKV
tara:strand:+ start:9810 stop:14132 length:4323 start_codon:yes stop_codon:yes gene_type:complete